MSFAVVRMQKMKSHDLKGIQFHNQRERESKTNEDIDPDRTHKNYMELQLTSTKGPSGRDRRWISLASWDFPVPLSPVMMMLQRA